MPRFEIERGESFDGPTEWKPAGEAEGHTASDAVDAGSGSAGWYRVRRPAPDAPWTYCQVTVDPQTGEQQIECQTDPPR